MFGIWKKNVILSKCSEPKDPFREIGAKILRLHFVPLRMTNYLLRQTGDREGRPYAGEISTPHSPLSNLPPDPIDRDSRGSAGKHPDFVHKKVAAGVVNRGKMW